MSDKNIIKIALDTSCLNVKKNHVILNELEQLDKKNFVLLTTSTVLVREQHESNPNEIWRKKYLFKIDRLSKELEVGKYGISKYGQAVYGSKKVSNILSTILSDDPRLDNDKWILHTAIVNKNHYFLTLNTKDFITDGKQEKIEKELQIKIRTPDPDFLQELKQDLGIKL